MQPPACTQTWALLHWMALAIDPSCNAENLKSASMLYIVPGAVKSHGKDPIAEDGCWQAKQN